MAYLRSIFKILLDKERLSKTFPPDCEKRREGKNTMKISEKKKIFFILQYGFWET